MAVADTTGAGDAFNAGLVAALARGASWPDALRAATRPASAVVARPSTDRYAMRPAGADAVTGAARGCTG
ncbi:MAG: pfkB family carbohydrate kinase [Solirubrobacteraceae bacterium]|nr:pfkB family carbohydrate kinase [Solirubrobacteraceae bacterium]